MTIYNLYIFDRHCACIYHCRWNINTSSAQGQNRRPSSASTSNVAGAASNPGGSDDREDRSILNGSGGGGGAGGVGGLVGTGDMAFEEEAKLVYGVVYSLRNLVNRLSPKSNSDSFLSYRTAHYKLHYLETPTNLKFVMCTDPNMDTATVRDSLRAIYATIYVEYVIKNPLNSFDAGYITNEAFIRGVQRFVRSLPNFE
ncbi:TRAPP subunit bet5 [Quaeritorhiza haematococci]|nr:TRAPP subunit bet5 [Quaeritorhiza haematococci]